MLNHWKRRYVRLAKQIICLQHITLRHSVQRDHFERSCMTSLTLMKMTYITKTPVVFERKHMASTCSSSQSQPRPLLTKLKSLCAWYINLNLFILATRRFGMRRGECTGLRRFVPPWQWIKGTSCGWCDWGNWVLRRIGNTRRFIIQHFLELL